MYLWQSEEKVTSQAGAEDYSVQSVEPGCMPRVTQGHWGLDNLSQGRCFRLSNLFSHCAAPLRLCFC